MKNVLRSVAVAATSLVLVAGPLTAASASSSRPVDVTGFTVKNVVFSHDGCKNVTVTIKKKIDSNVDKKNLYLDTDVTRGGYIQDWLSFDSNKTDRLFLCGYERFGKYKIGPTEVDGSANNVNDFFHYLDKTAKTFYVRAKAKVSISAHRRGKKVTLNVSAKRYNYNAYNDYSKYSPKAKFQMKSGKKWKTVKTVHLKSGKAKYSRTRRSKAHYRVTFAATSAITGATSRSVKK